MVLFKKKIINFLKKQVNKTGYQIKKANNFLFLDSLLNKILEKNGKVNFIQIGGNDGVNDDPLHCFIVWNKAKVSGVILEPVQDYFIELERNYNSYPNIKTLNFAIHNTETEMIINRVNPDNASVLPKSTKGIASFKEEHHINCKVPSEYIIQEKVKCLSLNSLLDECKFDTIDLLQIDTEGYDAEIILNIDFNSFKPPIINFEYYVPNTMSKVTFDKIMNLLHDNGYEIWMEVNDITAYQRELFIKTNN